MKISFDIGSFDGGMRHAGGEQFRSRVIKAMFEVALETLGKLDSRVNYVEVIKINQPPAEKLPENFVKPGALFTCVLNINGRKVSVEMPCDYYYGLLWRRDPDSKNTILMRDDSEFTTELAKTFVEKIEDETREVAQKVVWDAQSIAEDFNIPT